MSDNSLLTTWEMKAECDDSALVIPDGCRDLIFKAGVGERPCWFMSDLERNTYEVPISKEDIFYGYRFKPGAMISEEKLLTTLKGMDLDRDNILSRLENFSTLDNALDEALVCLASGIESVAEAAQLLGVSPRTLQRLVQNATGQSPVFWLRLARVRRAGRDVKKANSLAEVAFDHGFSDQAHMSREFQSWLSISPAALQRGASQFDQLLEPGYA